MEASPITQLGKYRLLRHLARGGMSDIYLAQEDGHDALYALKLVRPEWSGNYEHFRRETAILNTLKHEHILPIYDFCVEEEGLAYYVTPYIAQGSLKERLNQGPLQPAEAGYIISQVGDALQFIHDLGLIHRDIKPANILLDETDHVWLADFGLAKEANTPSDLTDSSCMLGTPSYIAPELLEKQANKSSDIYALGVVLYEMLTGALPFDGQTPLAICWKHAYELPPLPSTINPTLPVALEEVILRALEKVPAARFSSVREMVEAYQEALLAPLPVLPAPVVSLRTLENAPEILGSKRAQPFWPRLATFAQQRQNRHLAIAMMALAMLFFLGATTFALEYQLQPSATLKANAQMVALPTAHPTGSQVTPTSTTTPKPKPKPAAQTNPAASSSGGHASSSRNAYPPDKHQKHTKKHGRK